MSNDSDRPLRAGGEGDLSIGATATVRSAWRQMLQKYLQRVTARCHDHRLQLGHGVGPDREPSGADGFEPPLDDGMPIS